MPAQQLQLPPPLPPPAPLLRKPAKSDTLPLPSEPLRLLGILLLNNPGLVCECLTGKQSRRVPPKELPTTATQVFCVLSLSNLVPGRLRRQPEHRTNTCFIFTGQRAGNRNRAGRWWEGAGTGSRRRAAGMARVINRHRLITLSQPLHCTCSKPASERRRPRQPPLQPAGDRSWLPTAHGRTAHRRAAMPGSTRFLLLAALLGALTAVRAGGMPALMKLACLPHAALSQV